MLPIGSVRMLSMIVAAYALCRAPMSMAQNPMMHGNQRRRQHQEMRWRATPP